MPVETLLAPVSDPHARRMLDLIAGKLAYDAYDFPGEGGHLTRVLDEFDVERARHADERQAALTLARRHGAYGTCDWCENGPDLIAIDSTAGRRCEQCVDAPLCGWCGEAPAGEDSDRCGDCPPRG